MNGQKNRGRVLVKLYNEAAGGNNKKLNANPVVHEITINNTAGTKAGVKVIPSSP